MTDTAVAATFAYRYQAEFARETLRAAGIRSVLVGDDAGGAYAGMSFTRRIRLLVRVSELEEARALLAEGSDDADPDAA
jgi:hypothetical protein